MAKEEKFKEVAKTVFYTKKEQFTFAKINSMFKKRNAKYFYLYSNQISCKNNELSENNRYTRKCVLQE